MVTGVPEIEDVPDPLPSFRPTVPHGPRSRKRLRWIGGGCNSVSTAPTGTGNVGAAVGRAVWVRDGDVSGVLQAGNVVPAARPLSDWCLRADDGTAGSTGDGARGGGTAAVGRRHGLARTVIPDRKNGAQGGSEGIRVDRVQ